MNTPTVPDRLSDALAILTELPGFGTNNAAAIFDVIAVWTDCGYAGNHIQDALEHLWDLKLICTDDDETPPIHPRYSVFFSSSGGDAFVGHRAQEPERLVEDRQGTEQQGPGCRHRRF